MLVWELIAKLAEAPAGAKVGVSLASDEMIADTTGCGDGDELGVDDTFWIYATEPRKEG